MKFRARKRTKPRSKPTVRSRHWTVDEAKAHWSEVMRRARKEGPQHITVRGRDGVVVIAEEEFRRLKSEVTGAALIAAMQASPLHENDVEPRGMQLPVRDLDLARRRKEGK